MAKKRIIELTIAGYTFSLKNLKVHDDMSEETTCFSADLVCNGKVIAHCNNDGHGGCTDVRCYGSDPNYDLYCESLQAIRNIRDTEYEQEMDEYSKQFPWYNGKPWQQCYTDEHLADRLMQKQDEWDRAVKQLKKFAKKFPKAYIWCDGKTMKALPVAEDTELQEQGFENVTEWVR